MKYGGGTTRLRDFALYLAMQTLYNRASGKLNAHVNSFTGTLMIYHLHQCIMYIDEYSRSNVNKDCNFIGYFSGSIWKQNIHITRGETFSCTYEVWEIKLIPILYTDTMLRVVFVVVCLGLSQLSVTSSSSAEPLLDIPEGYFKAVVC